MVDDYHVQQTNSYTFFRPRQFIIPTNAAKIQHLKLYGAKHQITYDRGHCGQSNCPEEREKLFPI